MSLEQIFVMAGALGVSKIVSRAVSRISHRSAAQSGIGVVSHSAYLSLTGLIYPTSPPNNWGVQRELVTGRTGFIIRLIVRSSLIFASAQPSSFRGGEALHLFSPSHLFHLLVDAMRFACFPVAPFSSFSGRDALRLFSRRCCSDAKPRFATRSFPLRSIRRFFG